MSRDTVRSRPIFVVGAPRSGTTLLQYMLRSHPRISLPTGESHFIVPLCANPGAFGDLSRQENVRRLLQEMYRRNADFLDTDLHGIRFDVDSLAAELWKEGRNTPATIISGLFEKNAHGEGKPRWGDKTPYYVLHLPKIIEWFPGAQIIHLIRDGRDCSLSLINRRHDFNVYNSYQAAKYWQHYVRVGRERGKLLGPDTYIETRYEDLLDNPAATMERISTFLGEEYTDSLVHFNKANQAGKTPLLQKPVQTDNAGKWRNQMSRASIRAFESVAAGTLSQLGYPVQTSAKPLPWLRRAALRGHNWLMTFLNRRIRRPLLRRQ